MPVRRVVPVAVSTRPGSLVEVMVRVKVSWGAAAFVGTCTSTSINADDPPGIASGVLVSSVVAPSNIAVVAAANQLLPPLPAEVIDKTAAKYREAYERLTGQKLA